MAIVSVCALTFDPAGAIAVESLDPERSELGAITRRATRTATLDGGATIYDAGYTAADRTVTLRLRPDAPASEVEALRHVVKTHSSCVLALPDGIFLACPSGLNFASGRPSFTLLVAAAETEF